MKINFKIIVIILTTLFAVSGAFFFSVNNGKINIAQFEKPILVNFLYYIEYADNELFEVDGNYIAKSGNTRQSADVVEILPEIETNIEADNGMKVSKPTSAIALRESHSNSVYRRGNNQPTPGSSGGSSGMMLAQGGRSTASQGGGDSYSYGGEGSMITRGGQQLAFAPFNDNGSVLMDPGARPETKNNQILPVGNGVYVLSIMSLLYGLFVYSRFRRRNV